MNWYVLCTKPNTEIKVADALNNLGINAYCPKYKLLRQYSDRRKKIEKPLLKSYVLVNISDKERVKVFCVPGVKRYLFWLGKPATVRQNEVEIIQNYCKGVNNIPINSQLNIGNNFAVTFGPFKGLSGEILNITNNKLKIQLKNIGLFLTVNVA